MIKGIIKTGLALVATVGVREIVMSYCKPVVTETKGIKKACVIVGAIALTGAVTKMAENYICEEIETVDKGIKEVKKAVNMADKTKKEDEYEVHDLIFDTDEHAKAVVDTLMELKDKRCNRTVTVGDLYSIIGWDRNDEDEKYGWTDTILWEIVKLETGYKLNLSEPSKLEGDK